MIGREYVYYHFCKYERYDQSFLLIADLNLFKPIVELIPGLESGSTVIIIILCRIGLYSRFGI